MTAVTAVLFIPESLLYFMVNSWHFDTYEFSLDSINEKLQLFDFIELFL